MAMPSAAAAMSASSNTTTGALPPSSRCTRLRASAAASATSMPARTEPVIDTIAGDVVGDHRPAGVAVAADHVEHARREELGGDLGQQRRRRRRGVARLEHHRVAGRDAPGRTSRPPSSSGSSTARPGRTTPTGSRRIIDVMSCHVLAGALALEVAGGGGEEADLVDHRRDLLARGSARAACRCSRLSSAISSSARASTASAIRNSASERSRRRACRASPRTPCAAASIAASTSAGPDSGAVGVLLPRDRVDHRGRARRPRRRPTLPLTKFLKAFMAERCSRSPPGHRCGDALVIDAPAPSRCSTIRPCRPSDQHRRSAEGDQDRRAPCGDDARRRARARAPRHRRLSSRRAPARGRRFSDDDYARRRRRHRADRRRRVGAADGRQGQGAEGGGVRASCAPTSRCSPTSTSPPTPRSPRRCSPRARPASPTRRCNSTTGRCRCWRR